MPRTVEPDLKFQAVSSAPEQAWPAAGALPDLAYVRLTQRPSRPRPGRGRWLLLALILVGHVVLVWTGYQILRPVPERSGTHGVLAVILIESSAPLPAPPPLLPPPPLPGQAGATAPAPAVPYVPPAKGAIQAEMEGVTGPPLKLYGANGQIRLPPTAAPTSAPPAYRTPELRASHIADGKSPIVYKPTRFNQDWAPLNQTLGGQTVGRAFDKAVEKTTVTKTVRLPGDIKIHCAVSPLVLFLGCGGSAPPPPPDNDDDIRLSLPPAQTLTGGKVVWPGSASSTPPPASH